MIDTLIKEYVKRLSLNDINNYALKKGVMLKPGEDRVLYDFIKERWEEIYKGNDLNVVNYLKNKLSKETFDIVYQEYNNIKKKYDKK
ncbi:MAG: hypothetical protein RSA10_00965 [Bacilli bacterium]